jgi:hypothetical protein
MKEPARKATGGSDAIFFDFLYAAASYYLKKASALLRTIR